jgi:hypothetical protein
MKYLKAYIIAWKEMMVFSGFIYLIIEAMRAERTLALLFAYVCTVGAIAGPIGILLGKDKEGKVCEK